MNSTRSALIFAIVVMCCLTAAIGYRKMVLDKEPVVINQPELPPVKPEPPKPKPEPQYTVEDALKSITAKELKDHVAYLASDQLEGRMTGERGCELARDYLKKELESYGLPVMLDEFKVRGRTSQNVYAWMDGTEEPNQVVVVGAHYDHIGKGRQGIFYGADDNASGTAAVLEMAEALAQLKGKNKRTIVFQLYSGEELGLIGSTHYCENPKFPKSQPTIGSHIFMENLDMIGYGKFSGVVSDRATPIDDKLLALKKKYPFSGQILSYGTSGGASDHAPFARRQIPSVFLHTGTHQNYHKTTDTSEKLNYDGIEDITQFGLELLWNICQDGIQVKAVLDEREIEWLDHGVAPFLR